MITTDQSGLFEGYASTFNYVDRGNDMVVPGAFRQSLTERGPAGIKLLWQHDAREPIGMIDEAFEDTYGLYIKGRLLLDVRRAQEAHRLMHSGALDGLSIGFHTIQSDVDQKNIRILREVDLWEVSLVTFPMNDKARIVSFKSQTSPKEDFPGDMASCCGDPGSSTSVQGADVGIIAGLRHLSTLMTTER